MKYSAVFFVAVALFVRSGFSEDTPQEVETVKTYRRLIPADVLRDRSVSDPEFSTDERTEFRIDFPGMCFASTRCATVEPGRTWELAPFCGRSTCVVSEDQPPRLLELVEDCGPLPLANPKCKLDTDKTNKTAPFPGCCPIFTCEEGAKLEYPEIPTPPPASDKPAAEEKPKA